MLFSTFNCFIRAKFRTNETKKKYKVVKYRAEVSLNPTLCYQIVTLLNSTTGGKCAYIIYIHLCR